MLSWLPAFSYTIICIYVHIHMFVHIHVHTYSVHNDVQLHNLSEGSTTSERRRLDSEGDANHMEMVDSRQQMREIEEVEDVK